MGKWMLVFFLTPLFEMYLLIEVGGIIGAWPTIGLVVLTAVVGVALLRAEGFRTLTRGLERLNAGQLPAREIVEGLLLAVAGALLLTPGFVTDTFGFLLLVAPTRKLIAAQVLARVNVQSAFAAGPMSGSTGAESTRAGFGEAFARETEVHGVDNDRSAKGASHGAEPETRSDLGPDSRTNESTGARTRHTIEGEYERH